MKLIHLKLGQKGQTAVEYILLLVVVVAIVTSFLSYMKTRYLGDVSKCATSSKGTLLCQVFRAVSPGEAGGEGRDQFRYYRVRR